MGNTFELYWLVLSNRINLLLKVANFKFGTFGGRVGFGRTKIETDEAKIYFNYKNNFKLMKSVQRYPDGNNGYKAFPFYQKVYDEFLWLEINN